jgi:hypothetical protein
MQQRGGIPNREQMANDIKVVIEEVYRSRYLRTEGRNFDAIKRATDHALADLKARGFGGIADRLTTEIAHAYRRLHHVERVPALPAFTKAADEVLDRFAAGQIV